jgi:hypothetical protein
LRRAIRFLLVLTGLLTARPASAHPVPFTYLDLHVQRDSIDGTLIVHIFDAGHDLDIQPPERLLNAAIASQQAAKLVALLAPRLVVSADGRPLTATWSNVEPIADRQSLRLTVRYALTMPPATLAVQARMFPYDPFHQTFVNVYEGSALTQAILDSGRDQMEYYTGTRQGVMAVARKFAQSGVVHILTGPDHLIFLFGLLLLGGTMSQFVRLATAFTVAHTATLALAAFNVIVPSTRVIEPAIALTIVYVGADSLLIRGGRDVRLWIALAFGCIHGFGFAGALREIELSRRALAWTLLSFNAGVEVGQIIVLGVGAYLLAALRARSEAAGHRLAFAGSVVVMAAGTYWFIERVFFPGGIS